MAQRTSAPKGLSDEARLAKNKLIREAGKATRARRASMRCRVFHLKINKSSLSKAQQSALKGIFQEYKWVRNSALSAQRFDAKYATELKGVVSVVTPSGVEERSLRYLGSQMQQAAVSSLGRDLRALAARKKNGGRVGTLKFVRDVSSIELQQYGITYKFYANSKGLYTKIRVQNVPGRLRVRGFEQLVRDGIEFANAKLIRKPSGYYLAVTTYTPMDGKIEPTNELGVDFGVSSSFTLSDGLKVNTSVEEGERLKRLQRKLSRQVKGSNGAGRTKAKIAREYERLTSRKDELARQLAHSWTASNVVYFQDELISSWKRRDSRSRGSRKIHHSVLGRVKTLLKNNANSVMLPSWVATTAWCPACGIRTPHELSKRVYECACGYSADRDVHAARNMVILGKRFSILTSGTEGSAGGGNIRLKKALYAPAEQFPAKPETTTASVSP